MVIEENCEANDKMAYKEKSLDFMYIYRNYANILEQLKKEQAIKLGWREYLFSFLG